MGGVTVIMNNDVLVLVRQTIAESLHFQLAEVRTEGADSAKKIDWRGFRIGVAGGFGKVYNDLFPVVFVFRYYCETVQGKFPMLARSGTLCSGLNSRFWGT